MRLGWCFRLFEWRFPVFRPFRVRLFNDLNAGEYPFGKVPVGIVDAAVRLGIVFGPEHSAFDDVVVMEHLGGFVEHHYVAIGRAAGGKGASDSVRMVYGDEVAQIHDGGH